MYNLNICLNLFRLTNKSGFDPTLLFVFFQISQMGHSTDLAQVSSPRGGGGWGLIFNRVYSPLKVRFRPV